MFKCPECGKEFDKEKSLRLHRYKKHGWRPECKTDNKSGECQHNWRLLNPRVSREQLAIRAGYNEVCIRCEEVR